MGSDALRKVRAFRDAGRIGALEVQFARTLARLGNEGDPLVLLGAALASLAPSRGHICVELENARQLVRKEEAEPAVEPGQAPDPDLEWPDVAAWREALLGAMGRPDAIVRGPGPGSTPLVFEQDRLYLDRYWSYEERLSAEVVARTTAGGPDPVDLADLVDRLFPVDIPGSAGLRDAARAVARHRFSIVAGGPGTGKTTTVTKILAMLLELSRRACEGGTWQPPRIALMAPTGKAAARMKESVHREIAALRGAAGTGIDPSVLAEIRVEASTIHRALRANPEHPTRFHFDRSNPLPVDIAVVDEASMVDFALMTRLVEAIPTASRLVLLGDRDQLASVEAGAVLGDLCGDPDSPVPAGPAAPPLAGAIAFLRHPFRFGADTGIGALSRAIRARRADRSLAYLRHDAWEDEAPVDKRPYGDLVFHEVIPDPAGGTGAMTRRRKGPDGFERVRDVVLGGFLPLVRAAAAGDASGALALQRSFCVLTPHRRGRLGVEGLNERIQRWLSSGEPLAIDPATTWYPGRPILVTENDPSLELFNGDLGIVVQAPDGQVRAAFPGRGDEPRLLHPGRLPPHETVFAMTVHKSQGSQFDHVLLVLPEEPSPILTRELLYTAVTRASERVRIVGSAAAIERAIDESVLRFSGLREKVWARP